MKHEHANSMRSNNSPGCRFRGASESGYILLAVLCMVVFVTLSLSVAASQIAKSIQRDREQETIQRGKQYSRAIRLYYKRFGKYPSSINELEHANNRRFLRKRYVDPMTGKDDWKLIHLGEARVPALGFFGVPIGIPGATSLAGPFMNQPIGNADPMLATNPTPSSNVLDVSQDSNSKVGDPGTTSSSQSPSTGQIAPTTGDSGGVVIGQIVGVGIPLNKASLLNFRKQSNYGKWEFVYDPIQDRVDVPTSSGSAPSGTYPALANQPVSSHNVYPGGTPAAPPNP